ncbi:protein unc-13 homolog [Primulina huaijiensis]|uniref:protein unc-13 homolog n=1 Tax=Primulina huaijiensis TaxID=1492673 RepID=UPI003CC6E7DC
MPCDSDMDSDSSSDLVYPFGKLDGVFSEDILEVAGEIFFTACRSSPGFGGRSAATKHNPSADNGADGIGSGPGSPVKWSGVGMAMTSRLKRALGLKMVKKSPPSRRASMCGSNPSSGMVFTEAQAARARRPMTAAEVMRRQLRMTEESDNRLRKTITRTLVGKTSKRAEAIILPLELLRHLKPSEFNDGEEFYQWQRRKLKILEEGLLLHPSVPLEKSDSFAVKLTDIIQSSETKAIETGKNSETMKTLSHCVVSLASRGLDGKKTDSCHWADGYPLNVYIYIALLYSVFDIKDESLVLDEVDELLELIKKTWPVLGINRSIHNLSLFWVFFKQYVATGEVESDLLGASIVILNDVADDAKRVEKDDIYVKMLACVLNAVKRWSEKRLLDYHGNFDRGTTRIMENVLPLAISATKILEEDVPCYVSVEKGEVTDDLDGNTVARYIRSSIRNAFAKILEDQNINGKSQETREVNEVLMKLTRETEELAAKEKDIFTPILKKWNQHAARLAAATLHSCYGTLLKRYLTGTSSFTNEAVLVLQKAKKLEKVLIQMMVDGSATGEDGYKEIISYEVDYIIRRLLKQWIQERLKKSKEFIEQSKESETWNPKSKSEPYAHSAVELVRFAKEAVESFFEIPANIPENLVYDLTDGLGHFFQDYINFVASCGSKQNYLPTLPPLTRCSPDSKFAKLWKIASCNAGVDESSEKAWHSGNNFNPSISRGTQRLYIRLNTLQYLIFQLHSLDKTLSVSQNVISSPRSRKRNKQLGSSYFEHCQSAIQVGLQQVSEVAAYRLIFLDSSSVFYGSLYAGDVTNARIIPALRTLKQNIAILCEIITTGAQVLALKEVMKASFEAYLMVLLAGGSSRAFSRSDHSMIEEDFRDLKKLLCTCGESLIVEDVLEREAEMIEGVLALMSESTEQLIEHFNIVACEASGICFMVEGLKLPIPRTGKWNRSDPDTILRILCHRNEEGANQFLKKTFQLAKRRASIVV